MLTLVSLHGGLLAVLMTIVGVLLGLLGGGGSILTVPVLTWVAGLPPSQAITVSLAVVGGASLLAAVHQWRSGNVDVRIAALVGGSGILGAWLGSWIGQRLPEAWLGLGFDLLLLVIGLAMLRPVPADESPVTRPHWLTLAVTGMGIGGLTGLFGVGGGFVIVPALVLLTGMAMRPAVGTSLVIIAANALAGFVGHWRGATLDIGWIAALVAITVVGAQAGSRLGRYLPMVALKRGFALFVLVIGVALVKQQLGL